MVKGIHHINFIVRNLTEAASIFSQLLGVNAGPIESLPQRGVELVRFRLGDVWLILVHPLDPESIPGKYLAEHGEGFFLMSLEVDNVQTTANEFSRKGFDLLQHEPRLGLDGWKVMDLDSGKSCGINIQIVEINE